MKTKIISTVAPLYFTLIFLLAVAMTLSPLRAFGSSLGMDVKPENSTLLYRGDVIGLVRFEKINGFINRVYLCILETPELRNRITSRGNIATICGIGYM